MVMLVCILGGIGTAGVPAGSLPVVALILGMVGVPPEGIGLVLGVDRFLDMCRTTLNVTGDLVAATVVSAGEKDWDLAEHDPDISAEEKMARLPERSEEHTSELQSLMRISYAVFCLKKKTTNHTKYILTISKDPNTTTK